LHWEANLIHRPMSSPPTDLQLHAEERERACQGKEDAWLGCWRRKKRGALARGRSRPPLPGCPRPPESCGGGAAWRRSAEKATVASSKSPEPNRAGSLQAPRRPLTSSSAVFCLGARVKAPVDPCEA
jgi:hypothetical protein